MRPKIAIGVFLFLIAPAAFGAGTMVDPTPMPRRDEALDAMMRDIVHEQCRRRAGHRPERVRAAVIDLGSVDSPASPPAIGSWMGDEPMYPASVVKIYYMGAVYAWEQAGRMDINAKIRANLRYMIGPSSNVATQRVFYRLTGVDRSAVDSRAKLDRRVRKRESINEWLRGLGLTHTDAGFPTWDDSPAAGDLQIMTNSVSAEGAVIRRNRTTAEDAALFLSRIASDDLVSPEACEAMRALMKRDTRRSSRGGLRRIFQDGLPADATLFAKSGYTSRTSHDSGIVIGPDGRRFVLVVMTETRWDQSSFLADFARETFDRMRERADGRN